MMFCDVYLKFSWKYRQEQLTHENNDFLEKYAAMPLAINNYIAKMRGAICPRTAYASSGTAARECLLYGFAGPEDAEQFAEDKKEFKESLLQTKEFDSIIDQEGGLLESSGNVTVVLVAPSMRALECDVLQQARRLVSSQRAPLVVALFDQGVDAQASVASRIVEGTPGGADDVVQHVEMLCGYRIVSTFVSILSRCHRVVNENSLGSKGQPSVQSGGQFAYLWREWQERADERVVVLDSGKERVLQRLSERTIKSTQKLTLPGGSYPAFVTEVAAGGADEKEMERKYTMAEWDLVVRDCLQKGMDDFGVYNTVRLHTLGTTLEHDLIPNPLSSDDGDAATAISENTGADQVPGKDGRANFMVNMTLQCIPDRSRRPVTSLLDYGCAEGAITAELGRQLRLPATKIFGADVRTIPAHGFTFLPLTAENPDHPPAVGSILPKLSTGSVDLITSAMVLHHVTHVPATLLELRRVISPQGVLVLREHHCPSAEMAAFLDIMHGLYSLAWSEPVEWPHFLSEYRAWYRTREEWNDLVLQSGFMQLSNPSESIRGQFEAATRSFKKADGRYTNLIRAYYGVYVPRPEFELPPMPIVAPVPTKRRLEELGGGEREGGEGGGGGPDDKRGKFAGLQVFESKKYKGQFYILREGGKPVWVKLFVKGSQNPAIHPAQPEDLEIHIPDEGPTAIHLVAELKYN